MACGVADRNGKVSVNYFDRKILKDEVHRKNILDTFDDALVNHDFEVYFQPKFNLRTMGITGAESLVRWNHRELGFITPDKFIATLEDSKVIDRLDYYVLEETCVFLRKRIDRNMKVVPMSINVSPDMTLNMDTIESFAKIFDKYGISRKLVHFEITESCASMGTERIIGITAELKKMGFVIELDDFGSGFSSLNVLSEMPVDIIKLD